MPKYVTPSRYRRSYQGMAEPASAAYSDEMLAFIIDEAETSIDVYFGFPQQLGGLEPHVVYGWQQALDGMAAGEWRRRVKMPLFPAPARNISRFDIQITNRGDNSAQATVAHLNPGDIVLNNHEGYFEAVPLQAITYSPVAAVWGLGLAPPIALVDYESGFYLPFFGQPLYDQGDHLNYRSLQCLWASTYTLTPSAQPSVTPPIPPVIYKNGTVVSSGNYTVNYTEGLVTFSSSNASSDAITADFTGTIPGLISVATIEQTTYLIQQRALALMGLGGLEQVKNGQQQVRRAKTDDAEEDQLCAKARLKLAQYRSIPIAGA